MSQDSVDDGFSLCRLTKSLRCLVNPQRAGRKYANEAYNPITGCTTVWFNLHHILNVHISSQKHKHPLVPQYGTGKYPSNTSPPCPLPLMGPSLYYAAATIMRFATSNCLITAIIFTTHVVASVLVTPRDPTTPDNAAASTAPWEVDPQCLPGVSQ
jgi:hypothetical protein